MQHRSWSGLPKLTALALALCGACAAAAIALAVSGGGPPAVVLGVASVVALRLAVLFARPRAALLPTRRDKRRPPLS